MVKEKNNNVKYVEPLVSVITTVYNTEKYVERCFDSIMMQAYKNIEFIIVNNGSNGNIKEIVEQYSLAYPMRKIKYVELNKNIGLFRGRLKGAEIATGDYFAFIDSDDRISVDFYRLLVEDNLKNATDMSVANVLFEFPNGELGYNNLDRLRYLDGKLKESDLLHFLFSGKGLSFPIHCIWNKLYTKKLFNKCMKYLLDMDVDLIMCDDMVYATVFFCFAESMSVCKDANYYYYKSDDAYTSIKASSQKFYKNINDVILAFDLIKKFLVERKRYDYISQFYISWKNRYYRIWANNIESSTLKVNEKKVCYNLLDNLIEDKSIIEDKYNSEDNYFYKNYTKYDNSLEDFKNIILKHRIITFDIFDTLIQRPFFYPSDLFEFMNKKFRVMDKKNKLKFSDIRKKSESECRRKILNNYPSYEEITLDEIYDYIGYSYGIDKKILDVMKDYEVSLEKKYCYAKNTGKMLYEFSKYTGKEIYFISDIYLPKNIVMQILNNCGYYLDSNNIYISSELRLAKHTGNLFKKFLKENKIKDSRSIVHIGDNGHSDFNVPLKHEIDAIFIPNAIDTFRNNIGHIYAGEHFKNIFEVNSNKIRIDNSLEFIGIRNMLALVANKFFDNPYVSFNESSDFNSNPSFIGYYALGMHLYSLTYWLLKNTKDKYNKVHFIARDGYLVKQAFDKLKEIYATAPESNYLYTSRKALMPVAIQDKEDLYALKNIIDIYRNTPEDLCENIKSITKLYNKNDAKKYFESKGILFDSPFGNEIDYYKFIDLWIERYFDYSFLQEYKNKIAEYFNKIIDNYQCTFDMGYSGRTESILKKLLNKTLDAYYVHINNATPFENEQINNFKVNMFYGYTPLVTGTIREIIMSEQGPSCTGFKINNEEVTECFENYNIDFINSFVLTLIQNSAMEFIDDMINIYGEDLEMCYFQEYFASLPFEYYLSCSKQFDRTIFSEFNFEDDLFLGGKINALDFWNMQTSTQSWNTNILINNQHLNFSKWKKALYYFMFDRKMFKEKVKVKLNDRPFVLKFCVIGYHVIRRGYYLIRRKKV